MSNKRDPLFTHDEMRNEVLPKITSLPEAEEFNTNSIAFGVGAASLVLLTAYEADRAKNAELIQMAVDAMKTVCDYARLYDEHPFVDGDKFLAAAESSGFKPSEP